MQNRILQHKEFCSNKEPHRSKNSCSGCTCLCRFHSRLCKLSTLWLTKKANDKNQLVQKATTRAVIKLSVFIAGE